MTQDEEDVVVSGASVLLFMGCAVIAAFLVVVTYYALGFG